MGTNKNLYTKIHVCNKNLHLKTGFCNNINAINLQIRNVQFFDTGIGMKLLMSNTVFLQVKQ